MALQLPSPRPVTVQEPSGLERTEKGLLARSTWYPVFSSHHFPPAIEKCTRFPSLATRPLTFPLLHTALPLCLSAIIYAFDQDGKEKKIKVTDSGILPSMEGAGQCDLMDPFGLLSRLQSPLLQSPCAYSWNLVQRHVSLTTVSFSLIDWWGKQQEGRRTQVWGGPMATSWRTDWGLGQQGRCQRYHMKPLSWELSGSPRDPSWSGVPVHIYTSNQVNSDIGSSKTKCQEM
jgi:hypothetical protein